jgi:alpha-amylase
MLLQENCLKRTVFFTGGEAITATEYTGIGRVTEYKYGAQLGNAFGGNKPLKYLQNIGMSKTYCNISISVKFLIETFT